MLPPHIYVAFIHGNEDFNAKVIASDAKEIQRNGNPSRHIIFEGRHVTGPPELRIEALDWMLMGAKKKWGA